MPPADPLPDAFCCECREAIQGRIYVDGRDVPFCRECWNGLHYTWREARGRTKEEGSREA